MNNLNFDALNFIYQQIKEEINLILTAKNREDLNLYIDDTQLTQLNDSYAVITTGPTGKIILDKDDVKNIINAAIKKVLKKDIVCKIVATTKDDYADNINGELISDLNDNLMSEFTFDNFVVGPSNKQARMAAYACAVSPGQSFNPLIIYGNSGLGKTHLLNAIGNYIKNHDKEKKILCVSSMKFVNDVVKAINNNTIEDYKSKLNSVDVLLVDDIQILSGKRKSEEIFFNI
ncbi:MAG: DnaA/Hda family protein, partial [Erysipelotrichia bacterium]|nr:DnaA/Hda family protein [Erysipelotrichia bacterium]